MLSSGNPLLYLGARSTRVGVLYLAHDRLIQWYLYHWTFMCLVWLLTFHSWWTIYTDGWQVLGGQDDDDEDGGDDDGDDSLFQLGTYNLVGQVNTYTRKAKLQNKAVGFPSTLFTLFCSPSFLTESISQNYRHARTPLSGNSQAKPAPNWSIPLGIENRYTVFITKCNGQKWYFFCTCNNEVSTSTLWIIKFALSHRHLGKL